MDIAAMAPSVASDQGGFVVQPQLKVIGIVLNAPDPRELANFYSRLLGWQIRTEEPDWVNLANPDGGIGLSFQTEDAYIRPTWPADSEHQQMMMHLDIRVDDLTEAGRHAVSTGAVPADFQPQDAVRVYLDPAGHPFCLFVDS
jgi:predicted enzyme related to lactoylglutathione lyase